MKIFADTQNGVTVSGKQADLTCAWPTEKEDIFFDGLYTMDDSDYEMCDVSLSMAKKIHRIFGIKR